METTVNNTSIEHQPNILQDIQYQQQKQQQQQYQNQKSQQNDQLNNIKDINQVSKLRYKYKWYLVIFCFILQFVQLYTLQELSTNHDNYKQYFKNIIDEDKFEFQYNIIFSISLFILVFLELWTGYLCDQYGSTVILINQWKIMVFGTVLVGLGLFYYQFYFIFIGRVLINVSNSTIWISVSTFIQQYFNALEQSKGQAIMSTSVVAAFSLLQTIALIMLPVFQIQEITFLLYGLGFSLRIMISFPIQALLVPKYISGTAFAITRSIKGFLGFIIQFLNGWIAKNYGYLSSEKFCLLKSIVLIILIFIVRYN
ncbi:Major facilitator superfamily domain, general substrate transporter [Pseudocohnilembus persalinus]|uniref:Major facilitator superfamily domain, general substrate transporter n=1 Tax=Pseudocohnilembus persalinus TaxID=266149 RepID=A0A0V0R9B9_PSEPJ|nr:Major facilitator superfamily domain, general substrate transporter [Pseudocohnilembus persalinus]|eukprot:KRX11089.1 Major facilitator superfamily domain, general substrate transporter [Pseudocohnilembus persalinus]